MSRRVAGALAALVLMGLARAVPARAADVSALEQRSRAFYGLLEKGQREQASAQWPQLERDLVAAGEQIRKDRDRLQADLEGGEDEEGPGAGRDPRLRQFEVELLILDYHLAWVRYQAADLVDDAGKKGALLDNAVEGFSKFVEMKGVAEVSAESLYGRGLAYMELRDWKNAREDFSAAAKLPKTKQRAEAALAEVDRRETGKPLPPTEPVDPDKPLIDKLTAGLPKAGADPAVEKDVTALARGLAARGGEWPAKVQGLVTKTLGDGTVAGTRSSYGLYLLGQLAIDRNACSDLAPLVTAGAGVKDTGRAQWRSELLFFQGGCLLNAGKAVEAAAVFGELVHDFPEAPRGSEAAYLRVRALDVARAKDPAHGGAFEEALVTYVTRYPKADGAAEAHWLLGDLYRTRGDCTKAAEELGKVPAGPYATRARLAALECRTAALSPKTTAAERAALVKDLRAFVEATPAKGADEPRVARAALMGALVAVGTTPPDRDTIVALLTDFEKKYPGSKDLFPRALETRLEARVAQGQLRRCRAGPRRMARRHARRRPHAYAVAARARPGGAGGAHRRRGARPRSHHGAQGARRVGPGGRGSRRPYPAGRPPAHRRRCAVCPQALRRGAGAGRELRRGAARSGPCGGRDGRDRCGARLLAPRGRRQRARRYGVVRGTHRAGDAAQEFRPEERRVLRAAIVARAIQDGRRRRPVEAPGGDGAGGVRVAPRERATWDGCAVTGADEGTLLFDGSTFHANQAAGARRRQARRGVD